MSSQIITELEGNIFKINRELFPIGQLVKNHIRSVECNVIQIISSGNFSHDTIEYYSANFDGSFRTSNELSQSDDIMIETRYDYDGINTYSFAKYSTKIHEDDSEYIPIGEVKERYSNGLKVSTYSNYFSKVFPLKSSFFVYDTFMYDDHNLPTGGYQIWFNKADKNDIDTLKEEYIYDNQGRLVEYRKFPLGNFFSPLVANQKCIDPFVENRTFSYGSLCDTSILGVKSPNTPQTLVLQSSDEILINKINNRSFDIKINLIPNEKKIEANKNRVLLIEYGKLGLLPMKITIIYNQVILIYQFVYSIL